MDTGDRQRESHIPRAGCEGKTYELLIIFSDFYSPSDSLQSPRIVLLVVLFLLVSVEEFVLPRFSKSALVL